MNILLGCLGDNTPVLRVSSAVLRKTCDPFGFNPSYAGQVAFKGGYCEAALSAYALGNGYRCYLPTLQRFAIADSFAPFQVLNSYSFCNGDPVNRLDPSGHAPSAVLSKAASVMRAQNRIRKFKADVRIVDNLVGKNKNYLLRNPSENIRSRTINLLHRAIGRDRPEVEALNLERFIYATTAPRVQPRHEQIRIIENFPNTIAAIRSDSFLRKAYMKPLEQIYVKRQFTFRKLDTKAFNLYIKPPSSTTRYPAQQRRP